MDARERRTLVTVTIELPHHLLLLLTPLMPKAAETRANIIRQAAPIFNRQGFVGTSMADIMAATSLKKGGIYNHFKSKDELAIAAFDFYIDLIRAEYRAVVRQERQAIPRLERIIETFCHVFDEPNPVIQGGCPILNTAIDSDDTHPKLRQRSQNAMDSWRALVVEIINRGIRREELNATIDPEATTTFIIASLEGALMMSKLYGDRLYLQQTKRHLLTFLQSLAH